MPAADSAAFARQRQSMVDCQLRTFEVTDLNVLDRMNHVPRDMFVADGQASLAYSDATLWVTGGSGRRALLPPMVLGRLVQALRLAPTARVLDVGGGCGYSAAVMAGLAGSVVALESDAGLGASAKQKFATGGLTNVDAITGPLAAGCAAKAPFDAILVNGAIETGLETLLGQLADGGRLVCIEASGSTSESTGRAVLYEKTGGEAGLRPLFSVKAPILGEFRKAPAFAF